MATELKYNNIGSETIKAKTGKDWKYWIAALDKEKADKLSHKEITDTLNKKYKVSAWWSQMVAVGYEQAKGIRVKNQRLDGGFNVDISKVIETPLSKLYAAVAQDELRKKWLKEKIEIRKTNKDKSVRANFNDETANLSFMFYEKGKEKSQIVATETKLKTEKQMEERRAFWKNALAKLEGFCL
jgi:hypothetical protein